MIKKLINIALAVSLVLLSACQANKVKASADEESKYIQAGPNAPGTFYSLGDHLIRVAGVQKVNNVYQIRGNQSFDESAEPLYVINGVPVGKSYQRANSLVDVNDIQKVTVLKSVGATSKYGMRGASGVIEIITKTTE